MHGGGIISVGESTGILSKLSVCCGGTSDGPASLCPDPKTFSQSGAVCVADCGLRATGLDDAERALHAAGLVVLTLFFVPIFTVELSRESSESLSEVVVLL